MGLIPGLGRSPRLGSGNSLQYSCMGNSGDRGAWRPTVCVRHYFVTNTHTHTHTHTHRVWGTVSGVRQLAQLGGWADCPGSLSGAASSSLTPWPLPPASWSCGWKAEARRGSMRRNTHWLPCPAASVFLLLLFFKKDLFVYLLSWLSRCCCAQAFSTCEQGLL